MVCQPPGRERFARILPRDWPGARRWRAGTVAPNAGGYNTGVAANVYFDLTRAFNERGVIVALASGQAVVHYRVAIMSKDGDWVIRETAAACDRVRQMLAERGAWYRPGAPLDPRWLAGGWSSHFEFTDDRQRRVRCDFFSRPPRVAAAAIEQLFRRATDPLAVVDIESLIRMKRTQRAKDYAVIGELAARLPPEREVVLTTDPDRLMQLAPTYGRGEARPAVRAAVAGDRDAVIVALAREQDARQQRDRARMHAYGSAAEPYIAAFARLTAAERQLPAAHARVVTLADQLLPEDVNVSESIDDDAE